MYLTPKKISLPTSLADLNINLCATNPSNNLYHPSLIPSIRLSKLETDSSDQHQETQKKQQDKQQEGLKLKLQNNLKDSKQPNTDTNTNNNNDMNSNLPSIGRTVFEDLTGTSHATLYKQTNKKGQWSSKQD
jgi:hypothetical protein